MGRGLGLGSVVVLAGVMASACTVGVGPDGSSEANRGALPETEAQINEALGATGVTPATTSISTAARYCVANGAGVGPASKWVYTAPTGKLTYPTLATGDHVLDFSNSGYGGGGLTIPTAKVVKTLSPSGKDDTAAIQAALNAVAALPLVNGLRGAVLLAPGTFTLAGSLSMMASGVVLRGSGSGAKGTVVNVTGSPRVAVWIHGTSAGTPTGKVTTITDSYVPSGSRTFHVAATTGLTVGTPINITRTVTAAWVHLVGMDALTRNGAAQTWLAPGTTIATDRVITAVSGTTVTVDAPLSDALDVKYSPGTTVRPYSATGRLEQTGIESLHLIAPKQTVSIDKPTYDFLQMTAVENSWVRDVVADEFMNTYALDASTKWITIQDSTINRTAPIDITAGLPFGFGVDGQLTLVQRSTVNATNVFAYGTKSHAPGPNVALALTATGTLMYVEPHERWSTGLLADNVSVPSGELDYSNRGNYGTGQGWSMGFGVVWNSSASSFTVAAAPSSTNWLIGSRGTVATGSNGTVDSKNAAVVPSSLYLAQLCERLGSAALTNIGY
ncbi:MAG TPA: hypothetical protein VGI39_18880 [Polyangiaceae bacterium]|jgi:hypothetical protein